MKRIFKYTLLALCAVAVLGFTGCASQRGTVRQRKHKFQVVSLDKVSGSLSDSWRVTLTVANNTSSNMRIVKANAFVKQGGRKVARLSLDGEVLLPRRRCSQVDVPLRVILANPIAALSVFNKLRKGDFSGITIDYEIDVVAFVSHRTFEADNVSLEELARQFNLGLKK